MTYGFMAGRLSPIWIRTGLTAVENENKDNDKFGDFLDFSVLGKGLRFTSLQGVMEWLTRERDFWKWTEAPTDFNDIRGLTFNRIQAAIGELSPNLNHPSDPATIHRIVTNPFLNDRVPVSTSSEGRFFEEWALKDAVGCADGLRSWFGVSAVVRYGNNNSFPIPLDRVRHWVRGSLFVDGLPDIRIPADLTLEDLRREFSREMKLQKETLQSHLDSSQHLRDTVAAERNGFHSFTQESERRFAELMAELEKNMKSSVAFYRTELAVRSAVNYWEVRAKQHGESSRTWGISSVVLLLAAVTVLLWNFNSIGYVSDETVKAFSASGGSATDVTILIAKEWLGSITRVGLLVACVVWPLRILVRNYMSHAHLATDASERAVIVQTYLALLNDEELKGDAEVKKIMLGPVIESMFRHASDGIVKDDGMPWQPSAFPEVLRGASSGKL